VGVIARQGSKHFIVSLLTMGVGVFNNFYIYPQFWAAYGFIQAFKSIGDLILPFAMLGLRPVLIKFKYHFTSNGNNVFLFGLIWFLISSSLVILLLVLFQNLLLDKLSGHIPNLELVKDYGFEIIVSIYLFGIVTLLSTISLINKRIVVPSIIKDLIIAKIGIPIVILSSAYYSFSDTGLIWMYIGLLSCLVFMLLIYNFKNRFITYSKLVLRTFNKEKGKILNFGLYSVLDSAGAKLAFGIDIIMINLLLGNEATGVYAVFLFLSRVVKIPLTSIDSIANPVISQFWTANNTKGINDLYKKSGVTILSVSLGIFLLIYFFSLLVLWSLMELLP
jgi:O-antigen/teichoic acid export membrane protein